MGADNSTAEIQIDKEGKWLYVSNRATTAWRCIQSIPV